MIRRSRRCILPRRATSRSSRSRPGAPVPMISQWAAVDQIIAEQVAAAFAGSKSAQEVLDEAATRVEAFMADAGYY